MFIYKKLILILILIFTNLILGCSYWHTDEETYSVVQDGIGRNIKLQLPIQSAVVTNAHNFDLINSIGNATDKVIGVDANIYYNNLASRKKFSREQLVGENQKHLNYEKIIELNPQILILSDNGQWREAEKVLTPFGIKVFVLNAYYTGDFKYNCLTVGKLFSEEDAAQEFYDYFNSQLDYVKQQLKGIPKHTVYFEYRNENVSVTPGRPYYNMLLVSGGKNIFDDAVNPHIDAEEIIKRNPQYIVKVSDENLRINYIPPTIEDFKFRKEKIKNRVGWEEIQAVKDNNILLLSHYSFGGACEIIGSLYIAKFMYPEYLPALHPERVFKVWLEKYQRIPYICGHTYPRFLLND